LSRRFDPGRRFTSRVIASRWGFGLGGGYRVSRAGKLRDEGENCREEEEGEMSVSIYESERGLSNVK
jgi:hypothetical protein